MSSPFQLFPALDSAIEAALRSSIERWGVLVPVVKDQHGVMIDGHHRSRIADELGVDYETKRITLDDDADRAAVAYSLNADRRQLTAEQRLAVEIDLTERGHSLRAIAGVVGVSHEQVRQDLAGVNNLTPAATIVGKDGKRYPSVVISKNKREDRRVQVTP